MKSIFISISALFFVISAFSQETKHVVKTYSNGQIYEEYDMIVTSSRQMRVSTTDIFNTTLGNFQIEEGLIHGEYKRYDTNGNLWIECVFDENIHNGPYKEYFPDGTLAKEILYVDGKVRGDSKSYYSDGTLKETLTPSDDVVLYKLYDGHPENPSVVGEGIINSSNRFTDFTWHMWSDNGSTWTIKYSGLRDMNWYPDFELACKQGKQYSFFHPEYGNTFQMTMSDSTSYIDFNQNRLLVKIDDTHYTIPLEEGKCIVSSFPIQNGDIECIIETDHRTYGYDVGFSYKAMCSKVHDNGFPAAIILCPESEQIEEIKLEEEEKKKTLKERLKEAVGG